MINATSVRKTAAERVRHANGSGAKHTFGRGMDFALGLCLIKAAGEKTSGRTGLLGESLSPAPLTATNVPGTTAGKQKSAHAA